MRDDEWGCEFRAAPFIVRDRRRNAGKTYVPVRAVWPSRLSTMTKSFPAPFIFVKCSIRAGKKARA